MNVTFWGTRGSCPCPSTDYSIYGGNTSCISVNTGSGEFVIDAGTGLRTFGNARLGRTKEFHIALSHFHYDHILGIPFFKPIWDPKATINLYTGNKLCPDEFRDILSRFFEDPFLPMTLAEVPATMKFHLIDEDQSRTLFTDAEVRTFPLEHPGGAAGYSVISGNKKFAYVSDHENNEASHTRLVETLNGFDLIVFDGFFCNENYQKGWGHSTWEYGLKLAQDANVRQIAMFHHHVDHNDSDLANFERQAQEIFSGAFFAREGTTVTV